MVTVMDHTIATQPDRLIVEPVRPGKRMLFYVFILTMSELQIFLRHWMTGSRWTGVASIMFLMGMALLGFILWDRRRRVPRLELDRDGLTIVDRRTQTRRWAWAQIGRFQRGARPFKIEARVLDGEPGALVLKETDFVTDDPLHQVINAYRDRLAA